jgi:hypothetical protein
MPKLAWVGTVCCSMLYLTAQSLFSDFHIIVINVTLITQGHFAFLVVIQNKTTSLQKSRLTLILLMWKIGCATNNASK